MKSHSLIENIAPLLSLVARKKIVIGIILLFCISLGFFIAFTSSRQYLSQVKMVSNQSNSFDRLGGLGNLAGLAGVKIGAGDRNNELSPFVYEEVLKSYEFLNRLSSVKFVLADGDSTTLRSFGVAQNRFSLFEIMRNWFTQDTEQLNKKTFADVGIVSPINENILMMSHETEMFLNNLRNMISLNYDDEKGITSITALYQNPYISAQIVDYSFNYLSDFIRDHRTSQNKAKYEFVVEQLEQKRQGFNIIQKKLAEFRDRNLGSLSNRSRTELENLESQYQILQQVVVSLEQQKQEVGILLAQESAGFKIIEPAMIPVSPHKPSRKKIIIGFTIIGLFVCLSYLTSIIYLNPIWLEFIKIKSLR